MTHRRLSWLARVVVAAVVAVGLSWGASMLAQSTTGATGTATPCTLNGKYYADCTKGMLKQAARQAAANARKKLLMTTTANAAVTTGAVYDPGKGPDYFGTYPNYANSPVPMGSIGNIAVVWGGTGYAFPQVIISDAYGPGANASATAAIDGNGVIRGFTVTNPGSGYLAPVITITDCADALCSKPGTGEGANARAVLADIVAGTGLRKFVDPLRVPPSATPTACSPSGQPADCYEIWLVEYRQQMHSDLPPVTGSWPNQTGGTLLRGYVQVPLGGTTFLAPPTYLGPIIVAQQGRPVRVTFRNKLPTGTGGNLFIPVDTTYMGAGAGPNGGSYTQNRATVHLNGGTAPWISDGTMHQWITPGGETTIYPKGVSVYNVPDMPNPGKPATANQGDGTQTFYYTNQQSARLMLYHDHAMGITRLNVYAGEAAGYLLTDATEQGMIQSGLLPDVGIPLVIQDKTFVPGPAQLAAQDPSWTDLGLATSGNVASPNGSGALWFPHVYMPNQNPYDITGATPMGRWDYGPWFWPPYTGVVHGLQPNPYYGQPGQPPLKPGVPDTDASNTWSFGSKASGTPESFMDTPVVNGQAYPTLSVSAGRVRFRISNAANDRFLSLSLFLAADKKNPTTAGAAGTPVVCNGVNQVPIADCTEVAMVPFNSSQNVVTPFPNWGSPDDREGGVPDPRYRGPKMIQIGTEGGFLPEPFAINNQPINYNYSRRDITVLNVQEKALFLGPGERADVIVDFSEFAGSTLILYNDSPAPVPAFDPRLDYYTGDPDNTDTGGAPSTQPGYGPNTRTVMQIVVGGSGGTATPDYVNATLLSALQAALPPAFKASQDLILVPQAAYNPVYFPGCSQGTTCRPDVFSRISDTTLTFTPLAPDGTLQAAATTFVMRGKSIIEEFTTDYGRMNANLGVELPRTNATNQTSFKQNVTDPPTEVLKVADPAVVPIGSTADGTQIWKITHNGVDTHAIYFNMLTVQVVNRVGWDGAIRLPDPNEFGFKNTVRMNPQEDTIVAVRPINLQNVPFGIPNNTRLLAPTSPQGATLSATGAGLFNSPGPDGNPVTITNIPVNFGWEYVWHCHILGHAENDMMRPVVFAVAPAPPSGVIVTQPKGQRRVVVTWTDNAANETGFRIERAANAAFTTGLTSFIVGAGTVSYSDTTVSKAATYYYRVIAANTVGAPFPAYPRETIASAPSPAVSITVK